MAVKAKPKKPRPDFPLFPHATGRWAKKIRGKLHYFGKVADDPEGEAAVNKYLDQRDDLQAGRKPRDTSGLLTVRDLINCFLNAKRHLVDTRDLAPRTFETYHATCLRVADALGRTRAVSDLRADDFEGLRATFAKGRGPVALAHEVRHVRMLFKYAYDAGLIDAPMRFGPTFKVPSRRALRRSRTAAGPRMFEAAELRTILDTAKGQLRPMVLLGLNAGFGQSDCASLPTSAIAGAWIDFERPKTGVARRVPLWPETVAALEVAIANRPQPRDPADADLVFVTKYGQRWVRTKKAPDESKSEYTPTDAVAGVFNKLLKETGIKRPGLNFYALRHTFRTIADEARDQPAIDAIMGHDDGSMANRYRERIADERLQAVTDHVRGWVFG